MFLFAFTVSGQEHLSWINKNTYELRSDSDSNNNDLSFLFHELKSKSIVGLGEASHGNREFYVQKARIIEYLISKCNFKLLAFENPHAMMVPINIYLQTGEGNLRELMKNMALYCTEEIYNLVLLGIDSEDYWGAPYTRDKFMTEKLIGS